MQKRKKIVSGDRIEYNENKIFIQASAPAASIVSSKESEPLNDVLPLVDPLPSKEKPKPRPVFTGKAKST